MCRCYFFCKIHKLIEVKIKINCNYHNYKAILFSKLSEIIKNVTYSSILYGGKSTEVVKFHKNVLNKNMYHYLHRNYPFHNLM